MLCAQGTGLQTDAEHGDARAAERLLPLVYDELRRLAAAKTARERPDHSLSATALVQEALPPQANEGHFGDTQIEIEFALCARKRRPDCEEAMKASTLVTPTKSKGIS